MPRISLSALVCVCLALCTAVAHGGLVYTPYDDFSDNSIDPAKWNVVGGEVTEMDERLYIWINRNGNFFENDHSLATTEGKTGGEGILGFRLNSDRIPGRRAGPGDAEAAIGISNGADSIVIHWLNDVNNFIIRATGVYGSGDIHRWDPDTPGPAENLDGPFELRDHGDNSIGVYHNHTLEYTFSGISVQPDSYFVAEAWSDPGGGENDVPVDFDYAITVDTVEFLGEEAAPPPPPATGSVPEPSSVFLFGVGLAGLLFRGRQRKAAKEAKV